MKICNVHIRGFGGVADRIIEFHDGLNIIEGANEAGKTTIAEFIRAMLYGVDAALKKDVRENERSRYMPLGGGEMGGTMEVVGNDGVRYIITRRFGKSKRDDLRSFQNSITGEGIDIGTKEIGEWLIGLTARGFAKSHYIKQLSSKIAVDKDDEILTRLTNLSQTGEELTSYQNAMDILVSASRAISFRGKGALPLTQERICDLHREREQILSHLDGIADKKRSMEALLQEKNVLEEQRTDTNLLAKMYEKYAQWQAERRNIDLKQQLEEEKRLKDVRTLEGKIAKERTKQKYVFAATALTGVIMLFGFIVPILWIAILPLLFELGLYARVKSNINVLDGQKNQIGDNSSVREWKLEEQYEIWFEENLGVSTLEKIPPAIENYAAQLEKKERERTGRIIQIAENVRDIQNILTNSNFRDIVEVEDDIEQSAAKARQYEEISKKIQLAQDLIEQAFVRLQKQFGSLLNKEIATALKCLTNGKYCEVRMNSDYSMEVIDGEGRAIKGEYLSSGAYDQIYFAARMAIINILASTAPIILDDAFTQYDDVRHGAAMEYIMKRKNQVILLTCHEREYKQAGKTELVKNIKVFAS